MKFYDCKTAPSPRRVRIFIAEKGIDIDVGGLEMKLSWFGGFAIFSNPGPDGPPALPAPADGIREQPLPWRPT